MVKEFGISAIDFMTKSRGSVGTGDDTDVATPAVTAIIALGAIMALLRKKRNQNME